MCLVTMVYVYATCTVCVTILSTGGKFQPVSNFTELHALTQAIHSHALLSAHTVYTSSELKMQHELRG